MIERKNRYGRTAARIHDADGLARRPSSATIDIHAHIVVPQAAKLAQPHIDKGRLRRVLADWCLPYSGYHLFYPSRRQSSAGR